MNVERLALPPLSLLPLRSALRQALDCWWWLLRVHVADAHGLRRDEALGPPPAPWLEGWPRTLL